MKKIIQMKKYHKNANNQQFNVTILTELKQREKEKERKRERERETQRESLTLRERE